ncbi:sec-independent protein translocase protein TatC [Seinonella peptonophila]|uniref:Sec-independent protein translocase protein TatC n=1 Tax=Seinonella peptonophila TaxID=112248 RepID=A0A1M4Y3R8_9BACL|nr:twin-arginine translocase subunit TatC [Seinonella peptonophila]SHF00236.1 sec-independent protein translocase protein TatC [Seinonella peptonophila]
MYDDTQPLTEHLEELRVRLMWVAVCFLLGLIVSLIFADDIFRWIRHDALHGITVHALAPGDSLKIYMQISFICASVITTPVILYHLWQFVSPGLRENERRATLIYIPIISILFLVGLSFGYFVIFPYLIQFTTQLNHQFGIVETYGIYQYFGFMVNVIVPLALFFELPVVVLFLTRLRIISSVMLRKFRRAAYFLLVIIAAIITPPDLISNILVWIPLTLLYEISIWVATWMEKGIESIDPEDE